MIYYLPPVHCHGGKAGLESGTAARLVEQLGSDNFKEREAASKRLAEIGAPTLDASSYVIEAPGEGDEEVTGYNPVIIAEATTSLKRFSVSEAVMELDLTGAPCMVFQHGSSGRVNIIYRRPDGNIGWVDPPVVKSGG